MANLELTFYKGVPFDRENENVLHCSKADRDTFLATYQMNSEPIEIDKFFFNGTDERCFLNVSLAELPFNVNYLKVVQTLTDSETNDVTERVLFFFVNSFRQGAENSIELDLTIDKWQSWFEYEDNATIVNPSLRNALCVQGHDVANGGEEEEILTGNKSLVDYSISKFQTQFRIVLHCSIKRIAGDPIGLTDDEICFISQYADPIAIIRNDLSLTDNIQYARLYDVSDSSKVGIFQVRVNDIYVLPTIFLGSITSNAKYNGYFTEDYDPDNPSSYTVLYRIYAARKTLDSTYLTNETEFEITPEKAKITIFGNGKTNVELPYNNKTYKANVRVAIGTDIAVELFVNKQFFDITSDYKGNVTIDEYLSYNAQNRNAENTRRISDILSTVGSGIGMIGSIATGNLLGTLGSGVSLGKTLTSSFAKDAKLNDMANQPIKLATQMNLTGILNFTNGLAIYTITPSNYNDIISNDEYFGFKCNGFYDELSISANENDRFRYIQCSEIQIIGEFNYDVKTYLESLFKRGIRIWYDKSHYLDSMTQKIPENIGG